MSSSNQKHKAYFISQSDYQNIKPAKVPELKPTEKDYTAESSVLPDGTPNFKCPCLGNLPHGPCGEKFRASFSCWAKYKDEPEDSELFYRNCTGLFKVWGNCTDQHQALYKDPGTFDRPENVRFVTKGKESVAKKTVTKIAEQTINHNVN